MDPGSAGVAFVGFAASLVTLVAVVAKSSKVLYELRSNFKDAPEDVRHLLEQFRIFQKLLNELSARLQKPQDVGTIRCLQVLLELSVNQMGEDMNEFQVVVSKLHRFLNNLDSSMIRLRIRYHLNESTVSKYQRRISTHIYVLTCIQSIMIECVPSHLFRGITSVNVLFLDANLILSSTVLQSRSTLLLLISRP